MVLYILGEGNNLSHKAVALVSIKGLLLDD